MAEYSGRPRDDREAVRRVAAMVGLAGVPVSLRDQADAPGAGLGTGHWHRHVERLSAAYERSEIAAAQVPAGAVRDELDRLLHVLRLRLDRYVGMAEVGQALLPDDDTTDLDGTAPGRTPVLDGAAQEIDDRLRAAHGHLAAVAVAVEQIMLADVGYGDPDEVAAQVERLLAEVPAP